MPASADLDGTSSCFERPSWAPPRTGAADVIGDPQGEREPSLRLAGTATRGALHGRLDRQQAVERGSQLKWRPAARLLDEPLDAPGARDPHRPADVGGVAGAGKPVEDLDQLPDPPMEDRDDDELGHDVAE